MPGAVRTQATKAKRKKLEEIVWKKLGREDSYASICYVFNCPIAKVMLYEVFLSHKGLVGIFALGFQKVTGRKKVPHKMPNSPNRHYSLC